MPRVTNLELVENTSIGVTLDPGAGRHVDRVRVVLTWDPHKSVEHLVTSDVTHDEFRQIELTDYTLNSTRFCVTLAIEITEKDDPDGFDGNWVAQRPRCTDHR
jgi:hypothetical protein